MCRYKCEGSRCQSGQGMVWYAYKDCPSGCLCLPREATAAKATAAESTSNHPFGRAEDTDDYELCSEDKPSCGDESGNADEAPVDQEQKKIAKSQEVKASPKYSQDDDYNDIGDEYPPSQPDEVVVEEEEKLPFSEVAMEWLDDNYRFVFGGAVILFLFCTLLPTLIYLAVGGKSSDAPAPKKSAQEVSKAASASPTSGENEKKD